MMVKECIGCILDHAIFKNVQKAEPIPIKSAGGRKAAAGGVGAVFSAADAAAALGDAGEYNCTGNFWWVDPLFSVSPNVPINADSVKQLANQWFGAGPARLPGQLSIGLTIGADLSTTKGDWERVSPEEVGHAFLWAISSRIKEGAPEAELLVWRRHMLTTQFTFEVFKRSEDLFWRAVTLRMHLAAEAQAMVRTTFQMVHEVVEVKHREERACGRPLSPKQLYERYATGATITVNVGEDDFTQSFVDNALTVAARLFSNKAPSPPPPTSTAQPRMASQFTHGNDS
jgi:hypothetical protein